MVKQTIFGLELEGKFFAKNIYLYPNILINLFKYIDSLCRFRFSLNELDLQDILFFVKIQAQERFMDLPSKDIHKFQRNQFNFYKIGYPI